MRREDGRVSSPTQPPSADESFASIFDLGHRLSATTTGGGARPLVGAAAALAVTLPHAIGLGLLAFAAVASQWHAGALALWSAALPGAFMALVVRGRGVVYAPSTAVALLFGGMLSLVMRAGGGAGITPAQGLAITGVFVALGFVFQWLIGRAGLAVLSRFLPVSVTQGFSAGVGLSLVAAQWRGQGWAGNDVGTVALLWHLGVATAVVVLSQVLQRLWPRFPSLLLAVLVVSLPLWWLAPEGLLLMASQPHGLVLPPLPDWLGAPWWPVFRQAGFALLSLSVLMGVVNGLEVLVFHQQLETGHGVRNQPDRVLMRESAACAACALLGLIPASTSTSRSRTALAYTGEPTLRVGQWHALVLLLVALSGHLWLHGVAVAALAGALVVAGLRMVPSSMWQVPQRGALRESWWLAWVVALVFAASGGAMALVAGLTVSTLVLLRTSAAHAIRRMHLEGRLRSRHVRRAEVDAWLAPRMSQVAVFELQGIVSFGVAAWVVDQVNRHLDGHRCVVLDAARVPSWDETGYARFRTLAHDLHGRGIALLISGVHEHHQDALDDLRTFPDLDRALEWAEDQLLRDCPRALMVSDPPSSRLGDLGDGVDNAARIALEAHMVFQRFEAGQLIIRAGDVDRRLMLVQEGSVALSTAADGEAALRLAVIGPGMVLGEMAFLNGIARTAYAQAGPDGALVGAIGWDTFQGWTDAHPEAALSFMTALARMGIRRLGSTSQELRIAMM